MHFAKKIDTRFRDNERVVTRQLPNRSRVFLNTAKAAKSSVTSCNKKSRHHPLFIVSPMMIKSAILVFLGLSVCAVDAATKVAVLEFGKGGSVRRTDSKHAGTSVEGVASFWSALHVEGRNLQYPGMTVVPDLFKKADSGVVIGISGSQLSAMPSLSDLLNKSKDVVGHMEVAGAALNKLMAKVDDFESGSVDTFVDSAKEHANKLGLSGYLTPVDNESAGALDAKITSLLKGIKQVAEKSGKTVVVHLVVEEEVAPARRRLEEQNAENNNAENNNAANGENQQYFGYGYYNDFGEWVTPYKTMFQIQYFNVVLWTAVGLAVILIYTIYQMLSMPLEPDTLLFGESAKMVGDE